MIPRSPRKIDAATIQRRLADRGFSMTLRTIQRDLMRLSSVFPLDCHDTTKPYGWSWLKDADIFDIPSLDPNAALALQLAREHLERVAPTHTLTALSAHFRRSAQVLDSLESAGPKTWPDKVRVIPANVHQSPPPIDERVLAEVTQALFDNRSFAIVYHPRRQPEQVEYRVFPLALVHRGNIAMLIAFEEDDHIPKQFALHRIQSVMQTPIPVLPPEKFDVDAYIRSGGMYFLYDEQPVHLKMRVENDAILSLQESPLAGNQRIEADGQEHSLVTVTMPNTFYLRVWILGFGAKAQVLEPIELRQEIALQARNMARQYDGGDPESSR